MTLTITVPPPTGESRLAAIEQASKAADKAYSEIREARGAHHKKLRAMQVARTVRPDDIQKAQNQMEGVVKRGNEEVKRILDGAKQALKITGS
jgi:ribosome recycling factor